MIDVNKKDVKPWPEDWYIHVVKSNQLYFDGAVDRSIKTVTCVINFDTLVTQKLIKMQQEELLKELAENVNKDSTEVQIVYCIQDQYYFGIYKKRFEEEIIASVYRIIGVIDSIDDIYDKEIDQDFFIIQSFNNLCLCKAINYVETNSIFESMKVIENYINEDFNDNDDDDDDDDTEEPDKPINPVFGPVLEIDSA